LTGTYLGMPKLTPVTKKFPFNVFDGGFEFFSEFKIFVQVILGKPLLFRNVLGIFLYFLEFFTHFSDPKGVKNLEKISFVFVQFLTWFF